MVAKGLIKFGVAASAVAMISACSVGTIPDAEKDIQRVRNDASDLRRTAQQPLPRAPVSPVVVKDEVWVTSRAVRRENGDPLPRAFEDRPIAINEAKPMTLREIGLMISKETGIPVSFDADLSSDAQPSRSSGGDDDGGTGGAMRIGMGVDGLDLSSILNDANGLPSAPSVASSATGAKDEDSGYITVSRSTADALLVKHNGPLSALLEQVSSHFDVGWAYENNRLRFFKNVTRNFLIRNLPSAKTMESTITTDGSNGSSNGAGSASTSSQTSKSIIEVDIWSDLDEALQDIVNGQGRIVASRGTGTITVTAPPSTINRVDRWIKVQNERFSKQVAVSVQVLSVNLMDSDRYAMDLSAVWEGSRFFDFDVISSGAAAFGNAMNWSIISSKSNYSGTSGIIQALSERGDVSVVTTASATTLNNVPTPLQVADSIEYPREISVTTEDGEKTVDVDVNKVSVGFNMMLMPRVVNSRSVMLQYDLSQSELQGDNDGFDVYEFEGNTFKLANVASRAMSQQVEIPNGSTLVLTGFERSTSNVSKSGTGTADNMLFGGNQSGSMNRDIMVIMITPVILDSGQFIVELDH